MTRDEFNDYCGSLKATTNVIQWGNASVWKIGGKIFAICSIWGDEEGQKIAFKCSDLSYRILIEQEHIIPSPYLARAKWVQLTHDDAMSDEDIRSYISEAYDIIVGKLTKAVRTELGLAKPNQN
ncbi:MAG: MmcQ/YjbR family DNA-binding protein [Alphaproteobacteria bacterium]|nr:MmcQ/YjbR family DNA-binding protein [Rhodospirillales bacterium]MCW9045653.1 MmcQ/YjbR family DNA-binding protein [Alphaproteobacteria bacterium]